MEDQFVGCGGGCLLPQFWEEMARGCSVLLFDARIECCCGHRRELQRGCPIALPIPLIVLPEHHRTLPWSCCPRRALLTDTELFHKCPLASEFLEDDIRIFLILICRNPHLRGRYNVSKVLHAKIQTQKQLTFLKLDNPPKILPPTQVVHFLSGGAKILIFISCGAARCNSPNNLSPNLFVNVVPPDNTILPYNFALKSRSDRLILSSKRWCNPGLSSPMMLGSNNISGARKRSCVILRTWLSGSVYVVARPSASLPAPSQARSSLRGSIGR